MLIDLLKKRRSIRKYKNEEIKQSDIDYILKCALLSPSSRGINPWEFIVVKDKNILEKLSKSKHGAEPLRNAKVAIVVIADKTKTDVWVEDCSIASSNILLAIEDLNLGGCWIQIRNRKYNDNITANQYVRELLDIPENYEVESIISIGIPDEKLKEHNENQLQYDKIHYEKFKKL